MTTTKNLIDAHNELATRLGQPLLTSWKQAKDLLAARIEAMHEQGDDALRADAEEFVVNAEDAARAEADAAALGNPMETVDALALDDVLDASADGPDNAEEPVTEASTAEDASPVSDQEEKMTVVSDFMPTGESFMAPKRGSGIGKLVEALLMDPEGYDYPTIVEMVKGEIPEAQTSNRSIASVAAGLRRKGVDVPMRRGVKTSA